MENKNRTFEESFSCYDFTTWTITVLNGRGCEIFGFQNLVQNLISRSKRSFQVQQNVSKKTLSELFSLSSALHIPVLFEFLIKPKIVHLNRRKFYLCSSEGIR